MYSAVNVSNNILKRAFDEDISVSPMKLQKILYFVASEYAKRAGYPLLDDYFQPWPYGPVVRSVYDEFRSFGGDPIRKFGKDARGQAYMADEARDHVLADSLDDVWHAVKHRSAVDLSRVTHAPGSAWSRFYQQQMISPEAVRDDETYRPQLGISVP